MIAAGQVTSPQASEALETLCRTYWYPVYAFLRREGHGAEDAQDLAQTYFERLLLKNYPAQADPHKGRFRSFLLLTLRHFLRDETDKRRAQKRGGGRAPVPIDGTHAEGRYRLEVAHHLTPEKLFERRWAQTVLEETVRALERECAGESRSRQFQVLRSFLPGGQGEEDSYAAAGAQLGLGESAVKAAIHRLRIRYRERIREQIAHTVANPAEVEDELRHLVSLMG